MLPLPQGHRLELLYPIHTSVKDVHASNLRPRNLIIHRCRDLVTDPLTLTEFCRRPYVARSRWLVRAWDTDRKCWRNFYLGTSPDPKFRAPGAMRLAIYDPGERRPSRLIGRQFDPTTHDRLIMLRLIQRLSRTTDPDLPVDRLRVMADDLRVIA